MKPKALKLTAYFLALTALTLFAVGYGCIDTRKEHTEKPLIVFVYKTSDKEIEFWGNITDGINAASNDFDTEYKILGAKEEIDIEGNARAVLDAIEMKPDAIVLAASDYWFLEPYAKAVVDAGILLLTMDCDVAGGHSRCFIATDNLVLGRLMGEEMSARISAGGKVGVIGHIKDTDSSIGRVTGAVDALNERGNRVIEPVYCGNNAETGMRLAKNIIMENPDLEGLIGTNEMSALGVAMAVESLGMQDRITIVSCDNSSKQITYIEQGVIDVTLAQRPFNMGYVSVQTAAELLRGKNADEIPTFIDMGCKVITRENMFSMDNQKLLFPFRE